MGKILAIAAAIVAGGILSWLFMPTMQPSAAPVAFGQLQPIDMVERRARAEKLIGKPFQYITEDFARDFNWFWRQGPAVIDLAMDECEVIMSSTLFNRHVKAMIKQGLPVKQTTVNEFAYAPLAQEKTCIDLIAGYSRLIGREYPF